MRFKQFLITISFTVFLFSCRSANIKGTWEFVGAFEGNIKNYQDFEKEKKSVQNQGRLIFNSDSSFLSVNEIKENHKGIYLKKNKVLRLKYDGDQGFTEMKIKYFSNDFLFLYTDVGKPFTWVYKKVKK